jgi:hypothetical protein
MTGLIRTLLGAGGPFKHASTYLRELARTEHQQRCDALCDLSQDRKAYAEELGAPTMARIAAYRETGEDERRAAEAVERHAPATRRRLLQSEAVREDWLWLERLVLMAGVRV